MTNSGTGMLTGALDVSAIIKRTSTAIPALVRVFRTGNVIAPNLQST